MRVASTYLALFVICGACAPPATDAAADEELLRAELQGYYTAYNARDVDALVERYEGGAVIMAANEPVAVGTEAIRAFFIAGWEGAEIEVNGEMDDLVISGDWATMRGSWRGMITPSDGSPSIEDTGSFIEVYRRQSEGSWKSVWDIWNSTLPQP